TGVWGAGRRMVARSDIFTLWFSKRQPPFHCVESGLMYTRCQNNGLVCIAAFSLMQCSITWNNAHRIAKSRLRAALNDIASLFGRLLARRIERAGVVDFRNLVVAEAEH